MINLKKRVGKKVPWNFLPKSFDKKPWLSVKADKYMKERFYLLEK